MAYKIKRQQHQTEELHLCDARGITQHIISVDLSADGLLNNVRSQYLKLIKAQKEAEDLKSKISSKEDMDRVMENMGNIVLALFESVFGTEGTSTIVNFYENRVIEMVTEILPFIQNVVLPAVNKIEKSKRKSIIKPYLKRG